MAAEPTKPSSSVDSYLGSLISLTSKSEIRYEGVLYTINTDESSIGLRNVRSFGTEGRKKDGPQVGLSDKVYEYILFRGSDIKDLKVKSSPPTQASSSIDNDPAIIKSHYPLPAAATNLPPGAPAIGSSSVDPNAHASQLGHPGSSFQNALPLYQTSGNLGSWGPSPLPGANGSGVAMPMYWPGFYGPPNGLSHLSQQSLLRPPVGLAVPPSLQQSMQYAGLPSLSGASTNLPGSNLPEILPSLPASSSNSTTLSSAPLPQFNFPPMAVPPTNLASDTSSSSAGSKTPISVLSMTNLPTVSPLTIPTPAANNIVSAATNVVNAVSCSGLPNLSLSQLIPSVSSSVPTQAETKTPLLVTPDLLLQSGEIPITSPPSQEVHKDVEVVQVSSSSSSSLSERKGQVGKEAQPPLLPLPSAAKELQKPYGASSQHHNYNYGGHDRGRGRGRGLERRDSHSVTRFTEDFDFEAMNEKFNKDEVWAHLGKNNYSHKGNATVNGGHGSEVEDVKPVYSKDDFFDTLSCNTLDQNSQNGRPKFSEQLKLDAETFGDFVRYRGGHGGRLQGHGGRGRGSYYGRGYGCGYGYAGRGRARGRSPRSS